MLGLGGLFAPQAGAYAQVAPSILVDTVLPDHMLAYQERTVAEQGEGEWRATGISAGSFKILPRATVGQSLTSNAYATPNAQAAAYETLEGDVQAHSQWSRHSLVLDAYRRLDLYIGAKDRKEDEWSLKADADIDINGANQINLGGDVNRVVFNALTSDDVNATNAIVAFRYDHLSIGATRTFGAGRFILTGEHFHVDFLNAARSVDARDTYLDHNYRHLSAQGEYSFTPYMTLFSRFSYVTTDYGKPAIVTASTQKSRGGRLIVGARATVPGLARATFAMAYSRRSYDSAGIARVSGLSLQARADVFLSDLTTVRGEIGSRIVDAQLVSTSATRDKFVEAGVDHALLRNFRLGAQAGYHKRSALNAGTPTALLSMALRGQYFASRRLVIAGNVSYASRTFSGINKRPGIRELTGALTLTYRI